MPHHILHLGADLGISWAVLSSEPAGVPTFQNSDVRFWSGGHDMQSVRMDRWSGWWAHDRLAHSFERRDTIIPDYNREKDRTTIEETFRRLVEFVNSLDEERKRATNDGLGEDELALFDPLLKENLDKTSRERVKQASRDLLASIKARLAELDRLWEKEQTKADVEVFILDEVFASLPSPPFTSDGKKALAASVYAHV